MAAADYSNGPITVPPVSEEIKQGLPIVEHLDQRSWEDWLERHHAGQPGAWVKLAKKNAPTPTVTFPEALESALCYGWIDGQSSRYDEHHYLQRFTPRKPRSKWSQINREKVTRLIEAGRMKPAGLAQIEAAKADGRWDDAYAPQSRIDVPEDFQQALDANDEAKAFFATLTGSRRYAFLYRLHHVKAPDRRQKRIADYIERLSQKRTLEGP
jgi:uncharacterized protein YdeI (YjbR/CyaY-like superfamily)